MRPYFELILSWWVNINLYLEQYYAAFGRQINVYNMYNSSEWFYGFQIANDDHLLLLATNHAIFYEFIPMHSYDGCASKTITLDQVETNVDYALVITNNAGLWRYILGDIVRFSSLHPYMIEVTWRTKLYMNVFGEQMREIHISNALKQICQTTKSIVKEYTVWPYFLADKLRWWLEFLIEFKKAPKSLEEFGKLLDQELQKTNIYYEPKRRENILIQEPRLFSIAPGSFQKRMEKRWKLWWQNKIPTLRNDRTYLDQLREENDW